MDVRVRAILEYIREGDVSRRLDELDDRRNNYRVRIIRSLSCQSKDKITVVKHHTTKIEQITKRCYYSAVHRHYVHTLPSNITFL